MRNHPIVNGKPTTHVKLAERLGCGKDAARARYNKLLEEGTPVTLGALRALDRMRQRREKRDERIIHERQHNRLELWEIAAKYGKGLTVQRIQQIAGPLE